MAYGPSAGRSVHHDRGPNIFSSARRNSVNKHFIIWPPPFSFLFLLFFSGNQIRNVHLSRSLWPKSRDLYSNKFVLVCISRALLIKYGDFLNSFAMKERAGSYGSYDNCISPQYMTQKVNIHKQHCFPPWEHGRFQWLLRLTIFLVLNKHVLSLQ